MLTDQALFVVIFKTLTLVVLLVLAIYAYKHLVKPMVLALRDELRDAYDYFARAKSALEVQQAEIDQRAHTQHQNAQDLSEKIAVWRAVIEQDKRDRMHEVAVLRQQMASVNARQQDYAYKKRIETMIGLKVLEEVRRDLEHRYSRPESGDTYLHAVVQKLKDHTV